MKQLLFICSGNYYRSRYAEILFNARARDLKIDWVAQSRGFRLSPNNVGPISIHTAEACRREGLTYDTQRYPIVLDRSDLESADRVIALKETEHRPMMRAKFPDWEDRIEYWEFTTLIVLHPMWPLSNSPATSEC